MPPVIRVENLSKSYRIGRSASTKAYATLRESLVNSVRYPFRRHGRDDATPREIEFWALKGVDFDVQRGEVVGIIGRNGAGKSTLLKILSRITKPTTGRIELYGRVGSLLEVGTGFHPELTGRENIYLNGSILGMSRREINARFDRIVDFSGTSLFLDTPAKRYSSGMYVRLAFAVAAYFEPEILIIDEVLAVGDAVFQRRCIDRMSELARNGSTLLFVSHNMDLIPKLCSRALLLRDGQIVLEGSAIETTNAYLSECTEDAAEVGLAKKTRTGDGRARFERLDLVDSRSQTITTLRYKEDLRCIVDVRSQESIDGVSMAINFKTIQGARIISGWTDEVGCKVNLSPGLQRFECHFKDVRIRPGRQLVVELWMSDGQTIDYVENARVVDSVEMLPSGYSNREDQGNYLCEYTWSSRG